MVKVNNMERNEVDRLMSEGYSNNIFTNNNQKMNQLDQMSINNLSSKHMDYNQMMISLGHGRKVDIGNHFKKLNELKQNANNPDSIVENTLLEKQLGLDKRIRKKASEHKQGQNQPAEKEQAPMLS